MGKYGIGARVVDDGGDAGLIIDKRKGERLVQYDDKDYGSLWWAKSGLEPANENAAPAPISAEIYEVVYSPKVGDRVRFKIDNPNGGAAYGKAGEEFTVTKLMDYPCGSAGGDQVRIERKALGFEPAAPVSALEPAVAPATTAPTTWAPVVGKFGKTRDGRKVGPIEDFGAQRGKLSGHVEGETKGPRVFGADGVHDFGDTNLDLVAEWIEPAAEPVAVAPATATPTQPERKFKVGDVVNYIEGKSQNIWQGVTITKATDDSYYATCPDAGDGAFKDEWLEPAAPPAKFKVGDRVVYVGKHCEITSPERIGWLGTVKSVNSDCAEVTYDNGEWGNQFFANITLTSAPPIGSQVTITATGRLSAINENGHYQVTFPGLPSGQNSFALPAAHVAAAK